MFRFDVGRIGTLLVGSLLFFGGLLAAALGWSVVGAIMIVLGVIGIASA